MRNMLMGVAGTATLVAGMIAGIGTAHAANTPVFDNCTEFGALTGRQIEGIGCQLVPGTGPYSGSGPVDVIQNAHNSWECTGSAGINLPGVGWIILGSGCFDHGGG